MPRVTAWWPIVLRALAVVIAVLAVIDPTVTTMRRTRPVLSVVATDATRDAAVVAEVVSSLQSRYHIVPAALSSAAGTVLVGDRLPANVSSLAAPLVVVSPRSAGASVAISSVEAPSQTTLESRVPVRVALVIAGLPGRGGPSAVNVALMQHRVGDTLLVSQQRLSVARDTMVSTDLTFVPSVAEAATLQVRASLEGSRDTARTDLVVGVRRERWSVLFFDRRPSWMSTFVRRSVERDPRFAVTSRIVTSTNISRETGRAPGGLDAIAANDAFDAVVVGAPDALNARDVQGIQTLLRTRGASVLLLADRAATGPVDALLPFGGWRTTPRRNPVEMVAASAAHELDGLTLRGLVVGVASRLPSEAEPLAVLRGVDSTSSGTSAGTSTGTMDERARAVVWRLPVGAGQLIVSGAFDAWRYRDTAQSTFDATWRDLIADAAGRRQHPLSVDLSTSLVLPGEPITLTLAARDSVAGTPLTAFIRAASLAPTTDSAASSTTQTDTSASPPTSWTRSIAVRAESRVQTVAIRAPRQTGPYEIVVARGPDSARATLVVAGAVSRDVDADSGILGAWARSRGGRVLARADLPSLPEALDQALPPVRQATTWHPMRSPWWILPFALALAGEWWIRRRRGLA